jgi:hydroxymethylpyrimidine/phosphomethylpyrimidine kinase
VFGTSVITAVTSQNSKIVNSIYKISNEEIESQIKTILIDFPIKAIKIGMLFDDEIVNTVYKSLKDNKIKIILDTVMIATVGQKLLKDDAINSLCEKLIPISYLITPNLDETIFLLENINNLKEKNEKEKIKINNLDEMKKSAEIISKHYKTKNILIKGGHLNLNKEAYDVLYESEINEFTIYKHEYLENNNSHGSGCSLSSCIASYIAKDYSLKNSVKLSINYVHNSIKYGFKLGKGENGTLNHLKE